MKRNVDAFREERFDLLVIGGGITGAGVALDAALNGWRVGLIDRGDFASATSSSSSKLVHGGLRYLEHGAIRLVYEALHERRRLLHNAPHLVQPLRFILPFYERARVSPRKWRTGLTLYDFLAGSSNIRRSRPLSAVRLRREFPNLRANGLRGGAEYFDAQMDDARLCLEVVQTAVRYGACAANYVEAVGFERSAGRITGVRALDRVAGAEFVVRARQVLNAAGPGVDAVCRLAGDTDAPHLQPTKGVHLVVPWRGLTAAFLLLHPADGRVFFVIPWMARLAPGGAREATEGAKTLLGTTDTLYQEGKDTLEVTGKEIDYLLEGYNRYFTPTLEGRDVLGHFAGLRPLIRARPGEPSSLSREFRVFGSPSGLVSVAGGKYTTYRRMAEVVTERVARRLGRRHRPRTADMPLDGAPEVAWGRFEARATADLARRYGLAETAVRHLVQRYGKHAVDVGAYLERDPGLANKAAAGEPDLLAEFPYQREHEMAVFPADFLLRRTRLGLFYPDLLVAPPPGAR